MNLVAKALWKTPNNQDRLIFRVTASQVVYAIRGGNVMNEFTSGCVTDIADFMKEGSFHCIVSDTLFAEATANLKSWLEHQTA